MPHKLSLVLALALVVAAAGVARAQDDDDTPSLDDTPRITVVGTATAEATPDLATITLGVTHHAASAKAAADATSDAAAVIIAAAKAQGVKPADIATRSVDISQSFQDQQDPNGRFIGRKPNGFDAANTIAVRVRDLSQAGALAQTLVDKGANTLEGISFTIEHPQPILDRLAGEAVANAKRQAGIMAQAAGVKLGRVLVIERDGAPPVFRPLARPVNAMARVAAPAAVPVEPGSEELSASATVSWAIDQP